MMIECAPEKRESMVASDESTAAFCATTSAMTVFDRTMLSWRPSFCLT